MNLDTHTIGTRPPLVLGATGRIGTGFQQLAQSGHWPGPPPVWQARRGAALLSGTSLDWDILTAPQPDPGHCHGIICLAGVINGDLALNTALALAAIDFSRVTGCGPVLLCSTAAVYGPADSAVTEQAVCHPQSDYGRAKLVMEQVVADKLRDLGARAPAVCILRIGNVAGADALLGAAGRGRVGLDQFDDGHGPERSYIGSLDLARIMVQLIDRLRHPLTVPPVLNVAAPRPVRMAALLQAAGADWNWRPAPVHALRRMVLDTTKLDSLDMPFALSDHPAELIRQSRLAGWAPAGAAA